MAASSITIKVDTDTLLDKLSEVIQQKIDEFAVCDEAEMNELLQIFVDEWGIESFRSLGRDNNKAHRLMQKHVPTY